jgi:hypothetical protein
MGPKQQIQERLDFVRNLVARAYYTSEIVRKCGESDLFIAFRGETADGKQVVRHLAPRTIRALYVDRVRREAREHKHEAADELSLAYEQLLGVFRTAMQDEEGPNLGAAVAARRELNRMLGLRRRESPMEPVDDEFLQDQQDEMDDLMGGTCNGTNGNGG